MEIMRKEVISSLAKCNTFETHFIDYVAHLRNVLNGDVSDVSGDSCS